MALSVIVSAEQAADAAAIRAVHEAAFESPAEADIVDALRERSVATVSLVAASDGQLVGHILFSPVSLSGHEEATLMGLGPMAVLPAHQREGIGSRLVIEGLGRCRQRGCQAVVVVGHPEYYPRFGFVPASRYGISSEYDVPDEVFMVKELVAGSLRDLSGRVTYDEAFADA